MYGSNSRRLTGFFAPELSTPDRSLRADFAFCCFLRIGEEKMSPLWKKRGHHDLRTLRSERTASTAAVRTGGDFGSIPSPYDADFGRKIASGIIAVERPVFPSIQHSGERILRTLSVIRLCRAFLRSCCVISLHEGRVSAKSRFKSRKNDAR